ncbi:MAG: hypothetical protein EBS28_00815 [Chlamydiae bacterium]|nr:hypothetical protein [Chlamydiota bacterium]
MVVGFSQIIIFNRCLFPLFLVFSGAGLIEVRIHPNRWQRQIFLVICAFGLFSFILGIMRHYLTCFKNRVINRQNLFNKFVFQICAKLLEKDFLSNFSQ